MSPAAWARTSSRRRGRLDASIAVDYAGAPGGRGILAALVAAGLWLCTPAVALAQDPSATATPAPTQSPSSPNSTGRTSTPPNGGQGGGTVPTPAPRRAPAPQTHHAAAPVATRAPTPVRTTAPAPARVVAPAATSRPAAAPRHKSHRRHRHAVAVKSPAVVVAPTPAATAKAIARPAAAKPRANGLDPTVLQPTGGPNVAIPVLVALVLTAGLFTLRSVRHKRRTRRLWHSYGP